MNTDTWPQKEQIMRKVVAENKYMRFLGIEILELKEGYGL